MEVKNILGFFCFSFFGGVGGGVEGGGGGFLLGGVVGVI